MLVGKSEGKKKGEGADDGWRGLHMLLGRWGLHGEQNCSREEGAGNRGGQVSVFLPQGPAKLLGLRSSGKGQSGRAVVMS